MTERNRKGDLIDDPHKWTEDYAFKHLTDTFRRAADHHPDLMEPYINRLDVDDRAQLTEIMRAGLRETLTQRYPMPGKVQ